MASTVTSGNFARGHRRQWMGAGPNTSEVINIAVERCRTPEELAELLEGIGEVDLFLTRFENARKLNLAARMADDVSEAEAAAVPIA